MAYSGRCACNAVSIRIDGEPLVVRQCWCTRCQKLSGGGPSHNGIFLTADIAVTGEVASNRRIAASGREITWFFCPACGTQLYAASSAGPHIRAVRLGFLDDHGLKPTIAIWTDEAPPGAIFDPAMEQYPGQPPPPGAPR